MGKAATFLAWATVSCGSWVARDASAQDSPSSAVLAELGFESSGEGARQYLRTLLPNQKTRRECENLIAELDSGDFQRREAATKRLLAMPNLPGMPMDRAAESSSFEVRWRARHVLNQSRQRSSRLLFASLKLIQQDPPQGAAGDVLAIVPSCRDAYVLDAAHQALRATATKDDLSLFLKRLDDPNKDLRIAAIVGVSCLSGADAVEHVRPLLNDPRDEVALAASQSLANAGDRSCLYSLLRLLDSADAKVRAEASMVLRRLTTRNLSFGPYDDHLARRAAVNRWQQWIVKEGTTAKLNYPLSTRLSARGPLCGNTLVSTGSKGKVMELAPDGQPVWTFNLAAWSAEKLFNGNVLVASYTAKKVVEVDSAGNVVWELAGPSAMTAKPLLNGNILIADFAGRRVVEVDYDKRTVWEYQTPEECFDADRLPNGNTIFGCPNRVREVTPDGDTVHEWEIPGRLNGFQALASGNVLVANYGQDKVYELNRQGRIVWELAEKQPCDVFRLEDGRVLVSSAKRIIEVDQDKRVLRVVTDARYGSARQ